MANKTRRSSRRRTRNEHDGRRGKEETRIQLLDAAMELFARKGYRGASVRDLAAAAGVTTGGFYSNFRSKRDIYIAILDRIAGTIEVIVVELTRETITDVKNKAPGQVEYEILRRPIQRLYDEMSRHEALLQILLREGLGQDPDFQREIDRVWERFIEVIKRAMDMLVAARLLKGFDTLLFARAVMPMAIAMSIYDFRTKGKRRDDIVTLLASVLRGGATQWADWREQESGARAALESS